MELDEKQKIKFAKWKKKHDKKCEYRIKSPTEGGRFTYMFTPTGLGMIIRVRCLCGKEIDLTDSENW